MVDFLMMLRDRVRCRLVRVHGPGCRGRGDHTRADGAAIDQHRWVS